MIIKGLTQGSNYEKALKQRRLVALAMLAVGLVGFVCYFLLVPGSSLNDHARGFYAGGASGITGASLALLVRTQYLLTHPAAQKKAKIEERDERRQHIVIQSARLAGVFTFLCAAAALFILFPFSQVAYYTLLAVMVVYALSFVAASLWLSKKL